MKFIRERVLRNELMFGIGAQIGSSLTVEMIGAAGFDWTWIDCEHGAGSNDDLVAQIQAASIGDAPPVVRIAWNELPLFKRVLDLGAVGVMVPYVNTSEEARFAAKAMRYPPEGNRGVAGSPRCTGFGRNFDEYFRLANENLLTIVQIETVEALDNVEEIAAVDGVDVLFIGPLDLSVSMGIARQFDHPDFVAALSKVSGACKKYDKAAGILTPDVKFISEWVECGFTFLIVGSDSSFVVQSLNKLYDTCINL